MNYIHLQTEPILIEQLYRRVVSPSCGAVSSFIGITRDNFEGRRVTRLSYEAYEPMALKELNRLCDDARRKFVNIEHIAISHRLGSAFNYYNRAKKNSRIEA
ncbi:unnamed protein product [Rotaria magnacalcarata]|uniref:Molybdopterin synthase catalytic subunit n=1 Tax=Rotaria magnacalcarata TaxID=392030 RepID=A0A820BPF8_9BILA|nr:unnamed protein product [Rotaria magnacalcarata]